MRQCPLGRKRIGLVGLVRSLKWSIDEIVGEIESDPVKHDRSDDFVSTAPRLQYPDDASPDSSCQCTADKHGGYE